MPILQTEIIAATKPQYWMNSNCAFDRIYRGLHACFFHVSGYMEFHCDRDLSVNKTTRIEFTDSPISTNLRKFIE